MSKPSHTFRLERLQGQLGHVAYEMTKVHFAGFRSPVAWQPSVNAYRCEHCLRICVDLAGVDRQAIELVLAPGRLTISGQRALPEPSRQEGHAMQVLAMEIDHGPFERLIELPRNVDPARVTAEQRNGMLWITLPLQHH
jgi:HSP20 family protein